MTLRELYDRIDGDYTQATNVLRVDKLIDKHIRKLPQSGVVDMLIEAGKTMDTSALFEAAHAMKGVCGNLGLVKLAAAASELSEEFRPGNPRCFTDAEVAEKIEAVSELYERTKTEIKNYETSP